MLSDTISRLSEGDVHLEDPKVQNWLDDLQRAIKAESEVSVSVDQSHGLYYVLSKIQSGPANLLGVQLFLFRHLKNGELGVGKPYREEVSRHQKHLHVQDKELVARLQLMEQLAGYHDFSVPYYLYGTAGESLLLDMIATGRCHWKSAYTPPLSLMESLPAEISWQMDEQGIQTLHFGVFNQKGPIFFIEQPWYLDEANFTCCALTTSFDPKIAKVLATAPKIPPAQVTTVIDFLNRYDCVSALASPKSVTKERLENIKPVPRLRLFQGQMLSIYQYYQRTEPTMKAMAELSFDYKGVIVPWCEPDGTIHQLQDGQIFSVVRDKHREMKALQQLIAFDAMHLKEFFEFSSIEVNKKWKNSFLIEHSYSDPLIFSTEAVPKLEEAGWQIEFDADYPYQVISDPIDEWYSSIREDSANHNNWFGFELGISVKGETINLLPVLQSIFKHLNSKGLSQLEDSAPIYARLSDGRYLPLPSGRVKNLLDVLVELYDKDSLSDKQELKLSKLHAVRLLELDAAMGATQLRWVGGDRIREMAEKISQFSGIQSAEPPKAFLGELRPYQLEGLSWLQFLREYELGGILADEMGLGKTVQALSHITLEKMSGRMTAPCLVIAPTSLMFNWQSEARRFSPELRVLVLHGVDRKDQFDQLNQYDLILTTYPLIVRDKDILLKQHFYLLILDEAQCIKNAKSQASLVAVQLNATHRLCLTGTPMENHLGELWSLFNFMMPGLLGDYASFQRLFRTPIEKHENQERRQHLNRRIAPFLLRRTKEKVVKELPEKIEMIRHIELEGDQRDLYETVRMAMQEKIKKEISKLGLKRSHIIILDALLKLRQICCDPRLLKITRAKKKSNSAKLDQLMIFLQELVQENRRILLFSQFTEMLELIEEAITKAGIPYVKLTGKTRDRAAPVQQFQSGQTPLFLISLKAGGTGLNLTAADTVIHYDPWWNPAVENQATDRAHRIGQKKTVFVYKFVAKGTVEEKILEMQHRKKQMLDGLFSEKTTNKLELTEQDLKYLFDSV